MNKKIGGTQGQKEKTRQREEKEMLRKQKKLQKCTIL
jgi:hypothetical protein